MSHDLPEGWVWTTLGQLLREPLRNGHSAKASLDGRGVRTLTLSAVTCGNFSDENTKVTIADPAKVTDLWLEPGDLLVERSNTPELVGTCRLYRARKHWAIFPDLVIRVRVGVAALPEYVEAHLQSAGTRKYLTDCAQGTAGSMPKIDQSTVERTPLALAPLPEQRRIVEKIEALLEQVNRAKARLERVPLILKRFRQAVLAAACSGELTKEWRDARPADVASVLLADMRRIAARARGRQKIGGTPPTPDLDIPAGWSCCRLGEIVVLVTSGSRGWAAYYSHEGPLFVRAQNLNADKLALDEIAHVQPPANSEGARTRVARNDVLVTITGANVTKTALVERDLGEAYVSQHVGLVRPAVGEVSRWIYLWLLSPRHGRQQLLDAAYGAGKPGLNLDNLREVELAIPPLDEQVEIARRLGLLFDLAEVIERRVQAANARADKLPKAILSKAFAGELVPTEADLALAEGRSYETAQEILKRLSAN